MQKTVLGLKLLMLSSVTHLRKKEAFIVSADNMATCDRREG
jgi:hypothetical protein